MLLFSLEPATLGSIQSIQDYYTQFNIPYTFQFNPTFQMENLGSHFRSHIFTVISCGKRGKNDMSSRASIQQIPMICNIEGLTWIKLLDKPISNLGILRVSTSSVYRPMYILQEWRGHCVFYSMEQNICLLLIPSHGIRGKILLQSLPSVRNFPPYVAFICFIRIGNWLIAIKQVA